MTFTWLPVMMASSQSFASARGSSFDVGKASDAPKPEDGTSTTRSDLLGEQTSGPLESQVSTGLQTENPENTYLIVS
jgi:hypothetical protein